MKLEQIIISNFDSLMEEFRFHLEKAENTVFEEVVLNNNKCILRFTYDMGYILCDFANPKEEAFTKNEISKTGFPVRKNFYSLHSVWKFLYPNDNEKFDSSQKDINNQALNINKHLINRFKNILNGDFSWVQMYIEKDTRISEKVEYMSKYLAMDNPVRIMFNNGDCNWEMKFDEYKKYLDNLQN
jgi:hypothetical protein